MQQSPHNVLPCVGSRLSPRFAYPTQPPLRQLNPGLCALLVRVSVRTLKNFTLITFRFVRQTLAPLRFWPDNDDSTTVSYRSRELWSVQDRKAVACCWLFCHQHPTHPTSRASNALGAGSVGRQKQRYCLFAIRRVASSTTSIQGRRSIWKSRSAMRHLLPAHGQSG